MLQPVRLPGCVCDDHRMSDAPDGADALETDWQRKRRLTAVFGDVLPETTSDEREPETDERESASEAWLKAQVPPHHG